jgi:hypothetical protein
MTPSPVVSVSSVSRCFSDTYTMPSTILMPIGSLSPVAMRCVVTWPGPVEPVALRTIHTSPSRLSVPPHVVIARRPSGKKSMPVTCGWNPEGRRLVSA